MIEPTEDSGRGARARRDDGMWFSSVRYLVAWLLASGMSWSHVPQIGGRGEWPLRVALCLIVGGVPVVVAFVLGLCLRIRSTGRDWNRVSIPAWIALVVVLAAFAWHRVVAEWILGMPLERTTMGEDYAQVIALGTWAATVFLIVNFPRPTRVGMGFAETFSPARRRWLRWAACAGGLVVGGVFFLPAPLAGYWHTPYSDCLCASKNLLKFEDGRVFRWASAHGLVKEPYGTYRRHFLWVTWDTGEEKIEIRPGWFFMRVRPSDEHAALGITTTLGYRELGRDYIREVLATKPVAATATMSSEK